MGKVDLLRHLTKYMSCYIQDAVKRLEGCRI